MTAFIVIGMLAAFGLGFAVSWRYNCQVVSSLEQRLKAIDEERKLFLDHLARAGFGAPIFPHPDTPAVTETQEPEETPLSQQEKELRWLGEVSNRPGKLAQRVSRLMMKKYRGEKAEFNAAMADLEQAEKNGAKG